MLGLVIERPQHGYDLEQLIERRGIRQWTDIGFSSIYYLLTKLQKRGLLHSPDARAGVKSRRVFHATPEGRTAAARSVLLLIEELRPVQHPVLVGLSNLLLLSDAEYAEALRARLTQLNARLIAITGAQRAQEPLPLPGSEVFSYSLNLLEAERSWLVARIQEVPDDPED